MLVVRVELHDAITGHVKEIARANIANRSRIGGCPHSGESICMYSVDTFEYSGKFKGHKEAEFGGYVRWSTSVLQMIAKAILTAHPTKRVKKDGK